MSKKSNIDTNAPFPKKWLDKLPENWADGANSMKEDELKKVIVEAEGNLYVIEQEKAADANLLKAKEEAKNLGGAYRDCKNAQSAKIRYALWLLEGRGVNLDTKDDNE